MAGFRGVNPNLSLWWFEPEFSLFVRDRKNNTTEVMY